MAHPPGMILPLSPHSKSPFFHLILSPFTAHPWGWVHLYDVILYSCKFQTHPQPWPLMPQSPQLPLPPFLLHLSCLATQHQNCFPLKAHNHFNVSYYLTPIRSALNILITFTPLTIFPLSQFMSLPLFSFVSFPSKDTVVRHFSSS